MANKKGIKEFLKNIVSKMPIFKRGLLHRLRTRTEEDKKKENTQKSDYTDKNKKLKELDCIDISKLGAAKNLYRQIIDVLREMNYDGFVSENTMQELTVLTNKFVDVMQSAKRATEHNGGFCSEEEFKQIEELYDKVKKASNIVGVKYILDSDYSRQKIERRSIANDMSATQKGYRMENIDIR